MLWFDGKIRVKCKLLALFPPMSLSFFPVLLFLLLHLQSHTDCGNLRPSQQPHDTARRRKAYHSEQTRGVELFQFVNSPHTATRGSRRNSRGRTGVLTRQQVIRQTKPNKPTISAFPPVRASIREHAYIQQPPRAFLAHSKSSTRRPDEKKTCQVLLPAPTLQVWQTKPAATNASHNRGHSRKRPPPSEAV